MNNLQKAIDLPKEKKAKNKKSLDTYVFGYGAIILLSACTVRMFMLEAENLRKDDHLFMGAVLFVGIIVVAYALQAIHKLVSHK